MLVPTLLGTQPALRPSSSRAHRYGSQVFFAPGTTLKLQSKQRWEHHAGLRTSFTQSNPEQAYLEPVTKHDVQEGLGRICHLRHLREASQQVVWLSKFHPQLLLELLPFTPWMYFCLGHFASVLSFLIIVLTLDTEVIWKKKIMLVLNSSFIPFTFAVIFYPWWSLSLVFSLMSPCALEIHR